MCVFPALIKKLRLVHFGQIWEVLVGVGLKLEKNLYTGLVNWKFD